MMMEEKKEKKRPFYRDHRSDPRPALSPLALPQQLRSKPRLPNRSPKCKNIKENISHPAGR